VAFLTSLNKGTTKVLTHVGIAIEHITGVVHLSLTQNLAKSNLLWTPKPVKANFLPKGSKVRGQLH